MSDHGSDASEGKAPPHIRLNSGRQDPFYETNDGYAPLTSRTFPRPLTPQVPETPTPVRSRGMSMSPYGASNVPESSEFLLPPKLRPTQGHGVSETDRPRSPDRWSAARSSISSMSYESSFPFDPFQDSRAPSHAGSEEYDVNTQTVSGKFNIMPTDGLLLFPEDVEKDDYLHNPDPTDKDRDCDIWNRRGVVNVGSLAIFTLGLLVLFIGYPLITWLVGFAKHHHGTCHPADTLCLEVGERPLLQNLRMGLIDPDTPEEAYTKKNAKGKEMKLVFSDEFNMPGRTFFEDDDPFFQAVDLWYGVTADKEWYDPDAVTTADGTLQLRFDHFENHNLNYRSGMVQSWNKLCFKGGRLEASMSLPGDGHIQGFWPGFWAMGNLARPGYAATTDGMWPYSYHNGCDAGITPNQSSPDGINWLPGMRLPGCACPGSDHPTPGVARSAPEIDVIEGSTAPLYGDSGPYVGSASQSLQTAPFDLWYLPDYDFAAVYDSRVTKINDYRGGVYQQAMSSLTNLNTRWYNGTDFQTYSFEYTPGAKGDVTWFVGAEKTWTLDARAIGPNGNIGQRMIPLEPMALIMNMGMADNFAPQNKSIIDFMPAILRFDYVRIYQDPDDESVTCDPPGYETTGYIEKHRKAYDNANFTTWDEAGYHWPKNSYMHGCSAN
ncbi:Concanavalin A-like lectin/glucanases superfamily [Penicillium cf. griseofulvum]|uniref:Concanavalin A-like lectin/glucanases superfamily n=1 Tax=Penicillium cf. griseofulvum TaxID=2972120 RepID=A0A9W9MPV7_9EURO|nr:Concanavalin A-like lectin/glucanases superfamily [Penicillium cf. griseofulvum]KAJ5437555.1 Concanavalin A-like lectin/glucanases superfamily [Penicillium cf. griseofulvum]